MVELEVSLGRRAFPVTQQAFYGEALAAPAQHSVGWHDTSVNPEGPAFAVVRANAGLDDLIGEVLRVRFRQAQVFVYVLDVADVPTDISLSRRAFAALAVLAAESIDCEVAPVDAAMVVPPTGI